jgi:hypothetical protein
VDLGLFNAEISDQSDGLEHAKISPSTSTNLFNEDLFRFSSAESELNSHRLSDVDSLGMHLGSSSGVDRAPSRNSGSKKTTYQDFLHKMMHPDCELLVSAMRRFLFSILGPNGDGTPAAVDEGAQGDKKTKKGPVSEHTGYEFCGGEDIQRRCGDFLDSLVDHLRKHPFWHNEPIEELMFARDCLERYITGKIFPVAFKSAEVPDEDAALSRRTQLLSFLTPAALDIKPELRNDLVFSLAQDKLKKINSFTSPADKVNCIV